MVNTHYPCYEIPDVRTLKELVDDGCCRFADRVIFENAGKDKTITFRTFREEIAALGTFLLSKGMTDAHIALLGENSVEWIRAYFAITNSGNTVVPLDRVLPKEELAEMLCRSDSTALFYSDAYAETVQWLRAQAGLSVKNYYALSDLSLLEQGRDMLKSGDTAFDDVKVDPDRLASVVFTSGTSGKSKGVMLTHGNLTIDIADGCRYMKLQDTVIFLPLNHVFAIHGSVYTLFLYGLKGYVAPNLKHMMADLQAHSPGCVCMVPMMLEMIVKGIHAKARMSGTEDQLLAALQKSRELMAQGVDKRREIFKDVLAGLGGKLEIIISGGAPLDPAVQQELYDMGILVIVGYGITECGPTVTVNRNEYFRIGSVGIVFLCNEMKLKDPDADGIGEICVRGTNVMRGYYGDEKATEQAFEDGWFMTGDLGRMDEDGFLYLTGRKKNLIVLSNGKNVSPEELEERLRKIPGVAEVAVYDDNGKITGEFYLDREHDPDADAHLEQGVQAFNDAVPAFKRLAAVKKRETPFEKTTTMKIKRYRLNIGTVKAEGQK